DDDVAPVEADGESLLEERLLVGQRIVGEHAHALDHAPANDGVVAVESAGERLAVEDLVVHDALELRLLVGRRSRASLLAMEQVTPCGGDHDLGPPDPDSRPPRLSGPQEAAEHEVVERRLPHHAPISRTWRGASWARSSAPCRTSLPSSFPPCS